MTKGILRPTAWIVAAVALCIAGATVPEFYVTLLNYVGLYALVALGLVLLTGVSGITSFGQAAFVGLGAYTTAVLTVHFGVSSWAGLASGLLITLAFALVLGSITLQLSGHYLPLATICWSMSLFYIFGNLESFGGQTGLTGIPAISVFDYVLDTGRRMYFLIWAILFVVLLFTDNFLHSRIGRAMRALKANRETAENFGVNGRAIRLAVFVYAALLASLSGWLYAHLLRFVNPTPFGITMSIEYLFMAVVGGAGYVWGAVLGSFVITILREVLQDILPGILGRTGNFEIIVFGALVIVLLQLNRDKGFGALFAVFGQRRIAAAKERLKQETAFSSPGPVLEVKNVTKRFGGLVAVNDVSFSVKLGKILAVIGPNGAGKSTLFNLISGMLPLDGGEVWAGGQRLDTLRPHRIVQHGLARSYQHVQLVANQSVLDNVMFGAHRRTAAGAVKAGFGLDRREESKIVAEAIDKLNKLNLKVHARDEAGSLALGKQRMVEIARALCAGPHILLLDEPAAGLRHAEKQELADLLKELQAEGMSIVLVEHDMRFVMQVADEIVVLNFGSKLAEGTPLAIRNDPKVREAYLGGA